jgi:hypothetical protein
MDLRRSSGEGKGQDRSWPFFHVISTARRHVMIGHKFAVGQFVDYDRKLTPSPRPAGPYEVTRVLPVENAETQTYRIKSKTEPFERSAKEYEIVAVEPAASEMADTFAAAPAAHRRH